MWWMDVSVVSLHCLLAVTSVSLRQVLNICCADCMHLTLWTWVFPVAFHTSGILCCIADLCKCWCMLLLCIKHKQLQEEGLNADCCLVDTTRDYPAFVVMTNIETLFFFDEMRNKACSWNAKSWIIFLYCKHVCVSFFICVCWQVYYLFSSGILHFQVKLRFLFLFYFKHIYYLLRFRVLSGCKYYDYKLWNVTPCIFENWYRFCGNLQPTCLVWKNRLKGHSSHWVALRCRICYIYVWFLLTAYFLSWKWKHYIPTKRCTVPTTRHIIIIIIVIVITIVIFYHLYAGIYNYIRETQRVCRFYNVAAIPFQYTVRVMLFPMLNLSFLLH